MRITVLLLSAIIIFPAAAADCRLCGKWRSNAAKTLADIEARAPAYPQGLRKMFGSLTVEYTATASRAYAYGEPNLDAVPWLPYTLLQRPTGQPQVLRISEPDGKSRETAIEFQEDCYRVLIPTRQGQGFHEYFCRTAK